MQMKDSSGPADTSNAAAAAAAVPPTADEAAAVRQPAEPQHDAEAITQTAAPADESASAHPVSGRPEPGLWHTFTRGLWSSNPGLCQLLGLCPLLAVTSSATSALGLAVATTLVMIVSSLVISLLRKIILREIRIPLYVMLIAALVTVIRSLMEVHYPDLHAQLGIYLSLIVTNCIIMGRAEACAGRSSPVRAVADALGCSLGFALVLFVLGSVRELAGSGTWMAGATLLLGEWAAPLEYSLGPDSVRLLLAVLPPGGFFVLAFLIAVKNALSMYRRIREDNRMRIRSVRT